ncbi:membrane-spanning 4-domains subfamily A member 4A-like isoform X4 [Myxocyprinus asiaticus]|uniref:membrane-spanning 4-domains subfamily A member 4A-like isoform X4 n=1 Tax=Myxocyprinus asiaticus TaxID=70543 RepID=UPI00222246CE|nr:membrane-spanning 4-domains subfamily A member 4A-like isoform X4 [Myxocyprinus asiaticus]
MTSKIISTDNATVVIQINPQVAQDSVISDDGQAERVSHCSTVLKGFLKVQPKSLGYISAGSLSVAAAKKLNPCLVKASLGMNVFSTITAGVTIILTSIGIEIMTNRYCFYGNRGSEQTLCSNTTIHVSGINGILLVFSILQFIISICISAFACKVTCNRDSTVVNVLLNQRPDSQ